MPLRALRLLPFPTSSEATFATSLSFASTLQLAAGRAWSRRVIAYASANDVGKHGVRTQIRCQFASNEWKKPSQAGASHIKPEYTSSALPNTELKNCTQRAMRTKGKASCSPSSEPPAESKGSSVNVSYFDPQLHDYEPSESDLSRIEPDPNDHFGDIPSMILPQVIHSASAEPLQSIQPSLPPTPKSRTSLYRNLLYLLNIRKPVLRLPVFLDYHARYPDLQSTSSYNLLIDLCLRHRSLGIVRHLFSGLQMNDIPKNLETYKLEVRWLIYRGLWNDAWNYVQDLKNDEKFRRHQNGRVEIPYPIWLEFCRSPRRPRVLRSVRKKKGGELVKKYFETAVDRPEDLRLRQRLLNQNRPTSMPTLANTTPFTVYCLVQLLIRTGSQDRALALTKAYFKAMPPTMDAKTIKRCLNIIHVHMVATPAKDGLPRFYESRRTLVSLLKLHPRLRPNSRTLYLLLGPLQRAKRCGSIAWKVLGTFKSQWGSFVEDRRVQRRVTHLALKEGRMDVVENITRSEQSGSLYRRRRLLEERMVDGLKRVPARWHIRFPSRHLYPKNGREARLWYRLRARIRLKVYRRRRAQLEVRRTQHTSRPSTSPCRFITKYHVHNP